MSLRLSTVILPYRRWHEGGRSAWQRAEQLGFHTAYTYDHLSWRVPFRDGPWFGAVPTLTAAAAARRLSVAEGTVHKHLQNVYRKLGVRDRLGAVLRAQQIGMLRSQDGWAVDGPGV